MRKHLKYIDSTADFDKTEIAGWDEAFRLLNDVSDTIIFDIVEGFGIIYYGIIGFMVQNPFLTIIDS